MVYEVRCSYCGAFMYEKEGPANEFSLALEKQGLKNISHSICLDCRDYVLKDIASYKEQGGGDDE